MEAETAARARTYFQTVEEILTEVEKSYPEGKVNSWGMDRVNRAVGDARRLARAFTRFPTFDVRALARLKKYKFVRNDGGNPFELWVPAFAWASVKTIDDSRRMFFNPSSDFYVHFTEGVNVVFDGDIIQQNRSITYSLQNGRLEARSPLIPKDVKRRIEEERINFDDIVLVWDAEWTPAPVGDPLVIGVVGCQPFLIDEFDLTKLERYVSSEFCRPAKKE